MSHLKTPIANQIFRIRPPYFESEPYSYTVTIPYLESLYEIEDNKSNKTD